MQPVSEHRSKLKLRTQMTFRPLESLKRSSKVSTAACKLRPCRLDAHAAAQLSQSLVSSRRMCAPHSQQPGAALRAASAASTARKPDNTPTCEAGCQNRGRAATGNCQCRTCTISFICMSTPHHDIETRKQSPAASTRNSSAPFDDTVAFCAMCPAIQ